MIYFIGIHRIILLYIYSKKDPLYFVHWSMQRHVYLLTYVIAGNGYAYHNGAVASGIPLHLLHATCCYMTRLHLLPGTGKCWCMKLSSWTLKYSLCVEIGLKLIGTYMHTWELYVKFSYSHWASGCIQIQDAYWAAAWCRESRTS